MKKIFILYTGGTIGMVQSQTGLRPDTQIVQTALADCTQPLRFTWHICQPLIDSSALNPHHWQQWLTILREQLPDHDGAIVLHGTDTLAFTANFLALALDTHHKPVIITGSQLPFGTEHSDAPHNLRTAIEAVSRDDVQQVLIAFNGQLLPAVGSSKCSTEHANGFHNPHFGEWNGQQPDPTTARNKHFDPHVKIGSFLLTPNASADHVAQCLRLLDLDGAILLSYGHGNAPQNPDLMSAIQEFTQKGKILLNISQVPQGCARAVYAQGDALRTSGAINGGKCNTETALALLSLALSNQWQRTDIIKELQRLQLIPSSF